MPQQYLLVVDEADEVEGKHLPGQHDQRTHGHRFHHGVDLHHPVRTLIRDALPAPSSPLRTRKVARAGSGPQPPARPAAPGRRIRRPGAAAPAAPADPIADPGKDWTAHDLAGLSDADLDRLFNRAADSEDESLVERVAAEMDRRDTDGAWGSEQEQQQLLDRLDSKPKQTPAAQARAAYQDYLHSQVLAAEKATRGAVASAAGRAKGYGLEDFLTGRVPRNLLSKYASEELLGWLAENPSARLTESEWISEYLGRVDKAARERRAQRISEHG